ncbi:MAG: hypothetical protein HQL39_20535, partial [Alphaproteobacteria bacterium]|nr:hypothetical protein [Alphaproteobacteria bacterium]
LGAIKGLLALVEGDGAPLADTVAARLSLDGERHKSMTVLAAGGLAAPPPAGPEPVTLATSLAPHRLDVQRRAVASWLRPGIRVLSVNTAAEAAFLEPLFPQIEFLVSQSEGAFDRPLVPIDDLLAALRASGSPTTGILNSDIVLEETDGPLRELLRSDFEGMRLAHRVDEDGGHRMTYDDGYDLIMFPAHLISTLQGSGLCLGMTWWDYWLPLRLLVEGVPLAMIEPTPAVHAYHPPAWRREDFSACGVTAFRTLLPALERGGTPLALGLLPVVRLLVSDADARGPHCQVFMQMAEMVRTLIMRASLATEPPLRRHARA